MQAWDNLTLSNGEKFTVDSRWKDIYPDFAMVDPNGTEQATVANFMSKPHLA
jgi:S1-C subfamily serine protease